MTSYMYLQPRVNWRVSRCPQCRGLTTVWPRGADYQPGPLGLCKVWKVTKGPEEGKGDRCKERERHNLAALFLHPQPHPTTLHLVLCVYPYSCTVM